MFRVYDITTVLDKDCAAHNRNGFTCFSIRWKSKGGRKQKKVIGRRMCYDTEGFEIV